MQDDISDEFIALDETPARSAWFSASGQGIGPLPYRSRDRIANRNSFEQRTAFLTVTNRSKYFGYELITIVGFNNDRRTFEHPAQKLNEFDVWSFFVRGLIGFTEYGRPI